MIVKNRRLALVAFIVMVVTCLSLAVCYLLFMQEKPHPMPPWAREKLHQKAQLMDRIRGGDSGAATELMTAMLFAGRDAEAIDVLRYFLSNHDDARIDGQLGELLMNAVLRDLRENRTVNSSEKSESLALLRLAALKGDQRAKDVLDIYYSNDAVK